jgi:EryCIII-like glycosyltransferase
VRILGPADLAPSITAAGCVHRGSPPELDLDLLRPAEEQLDTLRRVWFGRELADAVVDEVAREPADALVVDYLLRSVAATGEALGIPTALLVHTIYGFHGGVGDDEETRRRWYAPVNASRVELGLGPLPVGPDSVTVALVRRAGAGIVVVPREFDDWPEPPANVVHVGWLGHDHESPEWRSPWPEDDERPLVVVTLGTTYMAHEAVLGRIAEALDPARARVLICGGNALAPERLAVPAGMELCPFVPHETVLPDASLVVTHAGTGTLLTAFGAGVPVVCLPLGRDQPANASRVVELGLGRSLPPDSSPETLGAAIDGVLADGATRDRARRLAEAMQAYRGGTRAVEAVETLGRSA